MFGRGQAVRWRFFAKGALPLQHEGMFAKRLRSMRLIYVVEFDRQYAR